MCSVAISKYEAVTDKMALEDENRKAKLEKEMHINEDPDYQENLKFKELYQDVLQQLECEQKLNQSMTDILENKVSELIAENGTLKLNNIQLEKMDREHQDEINDLKQHVSKLSQELENSAKENHRLQQILQKTDDSKISVY